MQSANLDADLWSAILGGELYFLHQVYDLVQLGDGYAIRIVDADTHEIVAFEPSGNKESTLIKLKEEFQNATFQHLLGKNYKGLENWATKMGTSKT
jgi:hypothetical protein